MGGARTAIPAEDFVAMLIEIWDELLRGDAAFTFVIDPGDSAWGPTLASLSAAQASRAMPSGTTIAAHLAYHLGAIRQLRRLLTEDHPTP